MKIRAIFLPRHLLVLAGLLAWTAPAPSFAQQVQVSNDYHATISSRDVSGALSHLADGDILAFNSDFVNGPKLYRLDANGDGLPAGGTKVLKQFDSSVFPDFVQVAPGGKFALAGVSGSSDQIFRIDLTTDAVEPYTTYPGNFDLIFIDDTTAYLSANPSGFDPAGPNQISFVQLSTPPVITPVVELFGTPSGPIALNEAGDLYYVKGTFVFPAPAGSSKLLRFPAAALAGARSSGIVLTEADANASLTLDGGYDLVFHSLDPVGGELFLSALTNQIFRIPENTLTPVVFLTLDDPTFPAFTGLSFFRPQDTFDASGPTHAELAASLATDFFSTQSLLQVRPVTYTPLVPSSTDENGFCIPGQTDCIHQSLNSSACVGANGFLSQVNIASVINLSSVPLHVAVAYFDAAGGLKGSVNSTLSSNLKSDFIINELGLQPDTIGTVCITTDGADGSWTGGIALYKPDLRNGTASFGDSFDFALFYPFLNSFRNPVTVPLNTFHLGTDPRATVANWIAIIDAKRDGVPLSGKLFYFNEAGAAVGDETVVIPDGGRKDYAGHVGIGGAENHDAIGMAQFVPDAVPGAAEPEFYMTVTRYFYDCPGSGCRDFLTAFNLPNRPGTTAAIQGGASTNDGEISIVELNNVATSPAVANVEIFTSSGANSGSPDILVPARGTSHLILNRSGTLGFLADNEIATASVSAQSGFISATSLFYKLNKFGVLEYAYAAPFAGTPGLAQVSQFNSFIDQVNVPEVFNAGSSDITVTLDFYSYTGAKVAEDGFTLKPNNTQRLSGLSLPVNDYGTIIIQGSSEGLVVRNYVSRVGQYTLPFGGE